MVKILIKKYKALKNRYLKKIIATCLAIIGFSLFFSSNTYAYSASANYGVFYYFTSNNPANIPGNLTEVSGIAPALNESWGHFDNYTQYGVSGIEYSFWPQNNQQLHLIEGQAVNMSITFDYYAWNSSNIVWASSNCQGLQLEYLQYYVSGQTAVRQISNNADIWSSVFTTSYCDIGPVGWPRVTFDIFWISTETVDITYFRPFVTNYTNSMWSCGPSTAYPCDTNPNTYGAYWSGLNNLEVGIEVITDNTAIILQQQLAIQRQEQAHRKELEDNAGQALDTGNDEASQASQSASTFTTNYLDVLIRLRDAVINVHITDCVLNFPNANGLTPMGGNFGIGSIDFCALSVPTPITAIASLAIFWLMVKLSIWVVRKFYDTFEEMLIGGAGK